MYDNLFPYSFDLDRNLDQPDLSGKTSRHMLPLDQYAIPSFLAQDHPGLHSEVWGAFPYRKG